MLPLLLQLLVASLEATEDEEEEDGAEEGDEALLFLIEVVLVMAASALSRVRRAISECIVASWLSFCISSSFIIS